MKRRLKFLKHDLVGSVEAASDMDPEPPRFSDGSNGHLRPWGGRMAAEILAGLAPSLSHVDPATRSLEMARGYLRRVNPEEAVGLWQALVDGRWSLLDQHEADGRRWICARRNTPAGPPFRPLTEREMRVLSYVALGQSNKLIAHTLQLTVAAVANLIARASHKLGTSNRVELIRQLDERTKERRRGDP